MILEFTGVQKIYPGPPPTVALKNVSFGLPTGSFTAVVGPSGSGKSSLLHIAAGLDRPTSGSVKVDGIDLLTLTQSEKAVFRRKKLGFVFQSFNLFPSLTALENIEYVMRMDGINPSDCAKRARIALDAVGLANLAGRFPNQMSGGQQQRIAVARAVASSPSVVLADEPTANLDSTNAESLIDVFSQLNRDLGTTFLFSTHDSRLVARVGTVIELRDGKIHRTEERRAAARPL